MAGENVSLEGMSESERNGLAAMHVRMLQDPAVRRDYLRTIKKLNPTFTAPELEIDAAMEVERKAIADREKALDERAKKTEDAVAAMAAERAEEKARAAWDQLKRSPIEAGIITAEELPALEKLMKDEGFNSTQYMQAAKFMKAQQVMAAPTPGALKPFRMPDNKELKANPKKFFQDSLTEGLNESNARRVAGKFGQ